MMGSSNPHPHGQVWSQTTIPDVVQRKSNTQRKFFQDTEGQSLLSAYIEQEIADETRVVYANTHFAAVVPWWAVWPFEVLVAPRRPMSTVGELEAEEATAFAKTLSEITKCYDALFKTSFPYSMGIHQSPTDTEAHDYWHWHMEFKPPLLRSASVKKHMVGYELFEEAQRDITAEEAAEGWPSNGQLSIAWVWIRSDIPIAIYTLRATYQSFNIYSDFYRLLFSSKAE